MPTRYTKPGWWEALRPHGRGPSEGTLGTDADPHTGQASEEARGEGGAGQELGARPDQPLPRRLGPPGHGPDVSPYGSAAHRPATRPVAPSRAASATRTPASAPAGASPP